MKQNRTIAILACLLLCAMFATAATQNAVVYGTVYDATGAPMAGATVMLENGALGFQRTTVTGSDGSYNFAEVPPSEGYKLTASRAGNKLDVRSGITVNVGDERVILPPLKEQAVVAAAAKTPNAAKAEVKEVKMTGSSVTNETVSTTISGVITGEQLRSLPLYNRNFLALGALTPNTHDAEAGSELAGGSFSVNGQRAGSNNFLLDGAENVATSSNQAIPFQVNDSIQEFRVTSATANAEYGRASGGTVNVVTRRGGNKFHGSAYGYFADQSLNGDNALSVYNGSTFSKAAAYAGTPAYDPTITTPYPLRYNDYVNSAINNGGYCTDRINPTGGTGPVACANGGTGFNTLFDPNAILAAHDAHSQPFNSKQFGVSAGGSAIANKLFYFGSYEGTLIDNPNPIFERVPSTFDRTYDPYATGAFGFASTDPNYLIAKNAMNLLPAANVVGVPGVLEFYQGTAPNYTNVHNFLGRLDWVQTSRTNWTGRYAVQTLDQLHDDTLPQQAQYAGNGAQRNALNQNALLSMSHSFTSNLINEARVSLSRFDIQERAQDRGFNATTVGLPYAQLQTIQLTGLDPQYTGARPGTNGAVGGWSSFTVLAPSLDYLFPMARIGSPLTAPSSRRDTTWAFGDNLSWSHGKHGFKFGVEYRNLANVFYNGGFSRGLIYSSDLGEFNADAANGNTPFTAPSFDFAYRQPQGYLADMSSYAFGWYAQDTWRLHRRLTVNLGLRWEYFSVPEEAQNRLYNWDQSHDGLVQIGHSTQLDPYGYACGSTPNFDSAPAAAGFSGVGTWNCTTGNSERNQLAISDKNNFAPRVGLAWDVFGTGKTVLRAGSGVFFDQRPTSQYAQLAYNRPTPLNLNNPQFILGQSSFFGVGGFGNNSVNPAVIVANGTQNFQSTSQPFSIYALDTRHSDTPYTVQYSGSLQQTFGKKVSGEFGYVGSRSHMLPVIYNNNFATQYRVPLTVDNLDNFAGFTETNSATASYNSLLARMRLAEVGGLRANVTYTYSQSFDNSSNSVFPLVPMSLENFSLGAQYLNTGNPSPICLLLNFGCGAFPVTSPDLSFFSGALTTTGNNQVITSRYLIPQDPFHFLQDEYGPSDFDTHHKMVIDYTWDVPTKAWGAPKWLQNFQMSGIFTMQSGQPFTVFAGPILGEVTQRANFTGTPSVDLNNPNGMLSASNFSLASKSAFCNPPGFFFGTSPLRPQPNAACTGNSKRNQFYGPDFINMNLAVQKGFQVFGEGRNLTLRAEFYNLFDRANYYNPISTLSQDGFSANPDFGKVKSQHDPRQIQLAVRFNW